MAQEELISSFFNLTQLEAEQKTVLGFLNNVLTTFNGLKEAFEEFGKVKSISQAADAIKKYGDTIKDVNVVLNQNVAIQQKSIEVEEQKARIDKETKTNTDAITKSTKENSTEFDKIKLQYKELSDLAAKYNQARQRQQDLKNTGGQNSGEYTKLTKEIEVYDEKLQQARKDVEALKNQLQSLPATELNTAFARGLQTRIDVKENVLQGKDVTNDTAILKRITEIDKLEAKLREVEALKQTIFNNGGSGSPEFIKASNEAERLRSEIHGLTEEVTNYNQKIESTKSIGAFARLKQDIKQAEENAADLARQFGVDSEQAQAAADKVGMLRKQFEEIKTFLKGAGTVTNSSIIPATPAVSGGQAGFEEIIKTISEFDQLKQELREAEDEAANLALEFGKDSEQAQQALVKVSELKGRLTEITTFLKSGDLLLEVQVSGKGVEELKSSLASLISEFNALDEEQKKSASGSAILGQMSGVINDLIASGVKVKDVVAYIRELNGEAGSTDQMTAALKRLRAEYNALSPAQKNSSVGSSKKAEIDSLQLQIAQTKVLESYLNDLEVKKAKLQVLAEAELSEQEKLTAAYTQLNAKYQLAADKAKNLAVIYGVDSKQAKEAAAAAQEYYQQLSKADQAVGDSRRNVGNYKSAFDGLTNAINQVVREVPNAAISMQTFFTAISNNLPILGEQIGFAIDKNKKLAAAGEETVPVLTQIGRSLASWQTLLVIGVTLLVQYGAAMVDWVKRMITGEESLEKLKEMTAKFAREAEEASQKVKELVEDLTHLNNLSRINLQIDINNIPKLDGLKTELQSLQGDYIINLKMSEGVEQQVQKAKTNLGQAQDKFIKNASEDAMNAYADGSIEDKIKSGNKDLTEKDKILFEAVKNGQKVLDDANAQLKKYEEERELIVNNQHLKIAEIQKEEATEERNIRLESVRAAVSDIKSANEDILNNDRSTMRQRLVAVETMQTAQKRLIEAEKNKVLDDPTSSKDARFEAIKKAANEEYALEIETNRKKTNIREEFYFRDLAAIKDYLDKERALHIEANDTLSNDLNLSLEQRLTYTKTYFTKRREQVESDYTYELKTAGLNDNQITQFNAAPTLDNANSLKNIKKTGDEVYAIRQKYETGILQLSIDTNKGITKALQDEIGIQDRLMEQDVAYIKQLYTQLETTDKNQYADDVIALNKSLADKTISYTQYTKQRYKLDQKQQQDSDRIVQQSLEQQIHRFKLFAGDKESLQQREVQKLLEIDQLKKQLDEATTDEEKLSILSKLGLTQAEYDDVVKKLNALIALEQALANARIKASDDAAKKQKADAKELIAEYGRLASAVLDFAQALGDGGYERQNNAIQDNIDLLQRRKDKEIETVNQSLASQDEKEKQSAKINARAAAQQEALEQRQKRLQVDQARFDKEMAVLKIVAQTAIAVATDNATPGLQWKIPFDIALGAIQIATVLAQPLPRYKDGTKDHEGGPAVVGDGGRHELIILPTGEMYVTPNEPVVVDLPKHSIVKPDLPQVESLEKMQMQFTYHTTDRILELYQLQSLQGGVIDTESIISNNTKNAKMIAKAIKNNRPIVKVIGDSNKEKLMKYGSGYDKG